MPDPESDLTLQTINQVVSQFVQDVERQSQALHRLRGALQRGGVLSADDAAVKELLAASVSVNQAVKALGVVDAHGMDGAVEARFRGPASREHAQLLAICSVSQTVNSTLDLTEVLNLVMDTIIRLTGAERGFVMLNESETGQLAIKTARNMDQETISGTSFEISLSIVNRVGREGRPLVTTNAQNDPRFNMQESVMNYSLRSILCVPLLVKEQVIGVIYADSRIKSNLFSERDLDVLVTFANQVATAIDNARLFDSVTVSKNLMDNIFASIQSGVITTDTLGKITLMNRAAENVLGMSARNCVGLPCNRALAALWATTPLPVLMEEVRTCQRTYLRHEVESHLHLRGAVTLSISLSPLKDANDVYQGVAMVFDDRTETKRLEAVREMFRRYVAPAVVDRLPLDSTQLRLGGTRQEVSVLFADLRGFTALSEELSPEELVVILNQYLSIAGRAVLAYEGTLDKFMGDGIMAVFNAPLEQPDHELNSIRVAVAIQRAVDEYHRTCSDDTPRLKYGIGINTGDAVVGNVGTSTQMNYTAIGDTVNLAKRLQERAAGGQIILSESVHQRVLSRVDARPLDPLQIRGRKSTEQVYELLRILD